MAAWHEDTKPGLGRNAWLGIAFALYLSVALGLMGIVLWKVAHPLPHIFP